MVDDTERLPGSEFNYSRPPDSVADFRSGNPNNAYWAKDTEPAGPTIKRQLDRLHPDIRKAHGGFGGTRDIGDYGPVFIEGGDEIVHQNGNAYIVLGGGDRTGSRITDGRAAAGETQCDKIDLVVGRMGPYGKREIPTPETNVDQPDPADRRQGELAYCDPSFKFDAARIYITQKSDIDDALGLPDGSMGCPKGRSAIGIKADGVRIVGREGIKLVTYTDTLNSRAGECNIAGIDLIAGAGHDIDLQPLVKGDNLIEALRTLYEIVGSLADSLHDYVQYQRDFNAAVMTHNHNGAFYGLMGAPSLAAAQKGADMMIKTLTTWMVSMQELQGNRLVNYRKDFLEQFGELYINSEHNNTT